MILSFNVYCLKRESAEDKVMYLCRGISGSGKSTMAHKLKGDNGVVFSTDDFFMKNDKYEFDIQKLTANHELNQKRTEEAMRQGISPIVVDNTNISKYEAKPYVLMAQKYGYRVEVKQVDTPWAFNAEELAKRNTHGVPKETIDGMLARWDQDFDTDSILKSKAPWEN
jgi:NEDD4-binding protein 2